MLNRNLKKVLFLLISIFFSFIGPQSAAQYLQDMVYTRSGSKLEAPIASVDLNKVLLANSQSVKLKELALGVNAKGDILVSDEAGEAYRWLKNTQSKFHKIITVDSKVFAAEDIDIINDKFAFKDYLNGRPFFIDTKDVALIISTNGAHNLLTDPITANKCLNNIKNLNDFVENKPATIHLSEEEQQYFADRAGYITRTFGTYLSIITDERTDELDQNDAVKQALKLFYDEERIVEVSSLNRDTILTYKIGRYLNRLRALTYARVEMVWNQISYVNQIRLGEDGEYRGVISVEQIFKGYNSEDEVIYQDRTQKNIEIIIKPLKQVIDGKEIRKWDVYLSDIGVKSTSDI